MTGQPTQQTDPGQGSEPDNSTNLMVVDRDGDLFGPYATEPNDFSGLDDLHAQYDDLVHALELLI